ncbi:Predicted permease [Desulfuromusa kysingii]|uniref:Predicted permease n=1 Tax=Desulfuromusa kysingii TaxID=37625 RepID=A0A1H4AVJ6_9BACT|nr:permease [Desulfuromusa kysingii]SEA39860.1 Predicted permease [Desulfuromusa kysingii]
MASVGLIYLFAITCCYLFLWPVDRSKVLQSLRVSWKSLLKMLPFLMAIFGLVGLFQEFVPPELITRFLGKSSGAGSLLISAFAGAISIGPPLAAYPLAETLLKAGAWPPAIATFIFSWTAIGIITLPFEATTFGPRFALLRNGISFITAILSGTILGLLL